MIRELEELAAARNIHRSIKSIAIQLAEFLPDLRIADQDTDTSSIAPTTISTVTQEVLRRHEEIMAELLRVSSEKEETTTGAIYDNNLHDLITELMGHWGEVGAALGLPDHPPLPRHPPEKPIVSPKIRNLNPTEIDTQLSQQNQKIDQILSLIKTLETKFTHIQIDSDNINSATTPALDNEGTTGPHRLGLNQI